MREVIPPPTAYRHRFRVEATDIDPLGHASNVSWVRWVQEAAAAHSTSVGLDLVAYRALERIWVVRRHEVDYLGQAFFGDTLLATTWVDRWRGATSLRLTQFHREGEPRLLARAATTWALLDANGRPVRIPAELVRRYGAPASPASPLPDPGTHARSSWSDLNTSAPNSVRAR